MAAWEHFPHGADIGIRGHGATVEQAFEQAALAMSAIVADPEGVGEQARVNICAEAPDLEILLVRWLNAIIFEMATRSMLFSRYSVEIDGENAKGIAWGEPVEVARHEPAVELKGATMTELSVHQGTDQTWFAQCVVDV